MESNTNQNITGGGATEVAGTAGATNQGAGAGQSVPTTSSTTNVAGQSAPATGGQSLASELEKELETTPAVDTGPEPEPALAKSKKKGGSGLIFAMVFVILLAAGGIGFGVWAMMDGNQQKEELNSQITSLKKQNSELMEKISDGATDTANCPTESNNIGDTENYIIIGEWGIKIKKPSAVKALAYEYNDYYNTLDIYTTTQDVAEFNRDALTNSYTGAESQIVLERYSAGTKDKEYGSTDGMAKPKYLFTIDGFDYFGVIGGTIESINEHYANSENYSAV